MNSHAPRALERAVEVSREILEAAERGDGQAVSILDAERLQLLKSMRRSNVVLNLSERRLVQEIGRLTDLAIGHLEHHRRIKGRQLDVATVGRRAVHAYSSTR